MAVPAELRKVVPEAIVAKIAQELAMGFYDASTILSRHSIDPAAWDRIKDNPYFQRVLQEASAAWESALNTENRVKLKAAAIMEDWLLEADKLAHDRTQPLNHKVELMKLIRTMSGAGIGNAAEGGGGERLSITINLGDDKKVRIEKTVNPQIVDGSAAQDDTCPAPMSLTTTLNDSSKNSELPKLLELPEPTFETSTAGENE